MEGGRGGGGDGGVVAMEDAVEALLEHFVAPLLPSKGSPHDPPPPPEKHEAVARQMHAVVLLYNYYHRKQFPQVEFLNFESFCKFASIAKSALLAYMKFIHECGDESGEPDKQLSVTDKIVMDACDIAEALDASKDFPNMTTWPVSKVAIFLLSQTKENCLVQYSAETRGVWSLIEKQIDAPVENSHSSNRLRKQASTNKTTASVSDEAYGNMLQQLAISEVQCKTGMKRARLRVVEEHLTYSLSKEKTTAKLYIMQYEQTVNDELTERPVKDLINSLRGPIVQNDPRPGTTSVVEYYHLLPYHEILSDCLHREWNLDASSNMLKQRADRNEKCSLDSEIDENLEEQEANSRSPREEQTEKMSTQKESKSEIKKVDSNSNSNSGRNKNIITSTTTNKNRRSAASRVVAVHSAEGQASGCPAKARELSSVADGKTLEFLTNAVNVKATAATSGGIIVPDTNTQTGKSRIDTTYISQNIPQDDFIDKAARVDPVMKHGDMENPNRETSEKAGEMASKRNDQMYASLQLLRKRRDDFHQKQRIIEDEIAQCEMDIQTVLAEGEMTPKVMSIIERYDTCGSSGTEIDFPSCTGERCQTLNTKRKRLSEAVLNLHSSCQELDEICCENNWILPRYNVLPSVTDGMFQATVNLKGLDFDCVVGGDVKIIPREARESAAAHMINELRRMAKQNA